MLEVIRIYPQLFSGHDHLRLDQNLYLLYLIFQFNLPEFQPNLHHAIQDTHNAKNSEISVKIEFGPFHLPQF